jgi:UDP-glucose 4-epimerase
MRLVGSLTGRSDVVQRLIGSLQIDSSLVRRTLDWTPPQSVAASMAETARWYRART